MKKILKRFLIGFVVILVILMIAPFLIPLPTLGVDATTLPLAADGDFVQVDGIQTFYIERGPEDGQTVLLLHGFGGLTFSWRNNIDMLAEAGHHVIAFDRPPFGLTEKRIDIDHSRAAMTDFTVHFMDVLEIDSAMMVGHSAGGAIIADLAIRYPERVDGLVFVDGAVGIGRGGSSLVGTLLHFPPVARWAQIIARNVVTPEYFFNLLQSAYADPDFMTPEIAAGYQTPSLVHGWDEGFVGILRDAGGSGIDSAQLASVDMPVVIFWGENDTWVPLANGETLHSLIPDSQFITYPNVGHLPMEENPEQFNLDLITFLDANG